MGGPMYYARLVNRNGYTSWGYRAIKGDPPNWDPNKEYMSGEFRRMEEDTFEPERIVAYSKMAGVTGKQAAMLLRTFMGIPEPDCEECNKVYKWRHGDMVMLGRCQKHVVY